MDLSSSSIFANIVVSTVGFGFFLYGKKQRRVPQLVTGVVLMVYPYFVSGAALMLAIGAAVVAALWIAVRRGL
jgi:hypothetical protein